MENQIINKLIVVIVLLLSCLIGSVDAQVYVEKQTRHRFAQMTMGVDYFGNGGVESSFLNAQGVEQALTLDNMTTPRLIIGGTHFWGHADFSVVFPLSVTTAEIDGQSLTFASTIETSFKYFPWRIKHHRFAPYVGISLSGYYFQQDILGIENGEGPELVNSVLPLMAGFTFNHKNHLIEAGVSYIRRNQPDYYIAEDYKTQLNIAPTFFNLSYKYMLDTSLSAERSWESGDTEKLTEKFASEGMLNNFFISAGPSAAFTLGESTYNTINRAFLPQATFSTFGDFGVGYYMHKPDLNFTINYRGYKGTNAAYDVSQDLQRQSVGFEVIKMLGDYHGFVPYVGPIVSLENLSFKEVYAGETVHDISESQVAMGFTFGWDIRPNRVQTWLLRTNLRWYPKLELGVGAEQIISFNTLEFNFIQAVFYPGRRKLYK